MVIIGGFDVEPVGAVEGVGFVVVVEGIVVVIVVEGAGVVGHALKSQHRTLTW